MFVDKESTQNQIKMIEEQENFEEWIPIEYSQEEDLKKFLTS